MDITVREHNRYGGGSVIVWGSMSLTTLTPLQVVDGNLKKVRYREEVLAPIALQALRTLDPARSSRTTTHLRTEHVL